MTQRGRGRPPHPGILTPAEQRVLAELRRGGTNAEIAVRLGVTLDTVKFHISNMLGKLGLENRRELAAWRAEPRRRLFGLLAVPGALEPVGRVLVWAGVAAAGAAAVAVVAVVLIVLAGLDGGEQQLALAPTATATPTATAAVPAAAAPSPAPTSVATPAATPALCTTPTDATCIRAVYRGAPDDYAQVADIPADVLLTPGSDGRYHVERGQQYTVVTAAPLPEGWTRFWLERTPLGTPSPVSASQPIHPVGTTYTFTVATDEATSTLLTFDLKQARPFVRPHPDGKPEIGAVVVTTVFSVVSCESGLAVTNPGTNAELVKDCETLLGLRDTLAGDAALNWAAGTAITSWAGVTVGGTPQRVTALSLANRGLTGVLSGMLGDLTGLTELRLNGNALAGLIPSKLAQLTSLTHVSMSGTAFTGCAPPVLRRVATNDVAGSGLADCGAPPDISYYVGNEVLTAGTYQFIWKEGDPPLIFDVPEGLTMRVDGSFASDGAGPPIKGLILEEAATGQSWIGLDVRRGVVYGMGVVEPSHAPRSAEASTPSISTLFDRLGESLWIGSTAE